MRTFKLLALLTLVSTLCVLPILTAEEKLDLPGAKPSPKQIEPPPFRTYPWERGDAAAIREKLASRVSQVDLKAVSFDQILEHFRDLLSVDIRVNWTALETAAIEKDKEITIAANDASMDHVLRLLLEGVGGGEVELDYCIRDNGIYISTREDFARRTFVHVYHVSDLLDMAVRESSDGDRRQNQRCRLEALIQETVDPESWRAAGGNVGAINDFADLLIVTQSQIAHQQIWDLLEAMRAALRNRQ